MGWVNKGSSGGWLWRVEVGKDGKAEVAHALAGGVGCCSDY